MGSNPGMSDYKNFFLKERIKLYIMGCDEISLTNEGVLFRHSDREKTGVIDRYDILNTNFPDFGPN